MEHFFDLERRGARLLRPLLNRVSAARLIPREEFFEAVERLYRDVEDVRQILLDADRTSARLVVNPAKVVIDETRRSFAYLSLYGVATDAVLVNRLLPERAASGYFARWAEREREELIRIEESFPVPLFRAPLLPYEPIGIDALSALADDLFGDRDPAACFTTARPIRLRKRGARTVLEIDMPGASKEEIEVLVNGNDLFVRVRDARRRIALPDSVSGRSVESVDLDRGVLAVRFSR
jgi:arsenite-transporting ATPase